MEEKETEVQEMNEAADEEEDPVKSCASLGERSQQCGGGSNLPAECCANMICNSDTNRCEAKKCSDLGERSQQCGGGGALPVTCCDNLVCNTNNRCDEEGVGNDTTAEEDTSVADAGAVEGDISTCASDGERSNECGAANPARPALCW